MTESVKLRATVNGEEIESLVDPRTPLAAFLRDTLGLTGTKVSCEAQICGACSVIVGDSLVSSCTFLAVDILGKPVETIEGIGKEELTRVQRLLMQNNAIQCGFCTPGLIVTLSYILRKLPIRGYEDLEHQVESSLCRCTGYVGIRATLSALIEEREDPGSGLMPPSSTEFGG